ncbi:hypothetical protein PLESTB_001100600 [Pleodorina starrii]|uniref:Uncharacterized protein n=1 Tax=Pleodorina starrii TaxID=330485 RepID=A0A9W6F4X4_9CHLO|nr:hypothetical protein PLESTB_001100600 [Pleodorina starrii]
MSASAELLLLKRSFELVAEHSRELSRTLEAKLSLSHDVPQLQAKLHRSKRKASVIELTAQLHEAQTRLLMAEEVGRQTATEVGVLKKALGLRSEIELGGGYDGQAQLLQALAKSQEESAGLAAQLAEGSRRAASLEHQVVQLQGEMDRLVGARLAAEEALVAARRETGEAHGRASALQIDLDELKSQLRRNHAHLQEVQAARHGAEGSLDSLAARNRALKEKLAATDREARTQVEALRGELRSLAQHAEREVEQLHALHASREGEWEAQVAGLQKQLAELEARLSQSDRDHEVEVLRLQSRTGALEASLEGSRLREASLERDAEAVRGEADRLARTNAELASSLAAARSEAEALSERAEEAANSTDSERRLRMQVQAQLEAATTRAAVREEALAAEAAALRGDVAALSLANERLRADLRACQEKLTDVTARQSINERHIDELHTTIQSLTRSKSKLQNTMLEQLSLFKSKLHQVEQENLTLRNALSSSAAAALTDPWVSRTSTANGDALPPAPPSRGGGGGSAAGGSLGGGGGAALGGGTAAAAGSNLSGGAAAAGSGGGSSSSGGLGNSSSGSELTAGNLAAAQAIVRAGISGGGSSISTGTTITQTLTLRDSQLGGGGGSATFHAGGGSGGGGGGASGGGATGASYPSDTSSLAFDSSRSEGGMEATLAPYGMQ